MVTIGKIYVLFIIFCLNSYTLSSTNVLKSLTQNKDVLKRMKRNDVYPNPSYGSDRRQYRPQSYLFENQPLWGPFLDYENLPNIFDTFESDNRFNNFEYPDNGDGVHNFEHNKNNHDHKLNNFDQNHESKYNYFEKNHDTRFHDFEDSGHGDGFHNAGSKYGDRFNDFEHPGHNLAHHPSFPHSPSGHKETSSQAPQINDNDSSEGEPEEVNFPGISGNEKKTSTTERVSILGSPVIIPPSAISTDEIIFQDESVETTKQRQCVQDCNSTSEYDPVCGTDNITYFNPKKFKCARDCGMHVFIKSQGRCPGATSQTRE